CSTSGCTAAATASACSRRSRPPGAAPSSSRCAPSGASSPVGRSAEARAATAGFERQRGLRGARPLAALLGERSALPDLAAGRAAPGLLAWRVVFAWARCFDASRALAAAAPVLRPLAFLARGRFFAAFALTAGFFLAPTPVFLAFAAAAAFAPTLRLPAFVPPARAAFLAPFEAARLVAAPPTFFLVLATARVTARLAAFATLLLPSPVLRSPFALALLALAGFAARDGARRGLAFAAGAGVAWAAAPFITGSSLSASSGRPSAPPCRSASVSSSFWSSLVNSNGLSM